MDFSPVVVATSSIMITQWPMHTVWNRLQVNKKNYLRYLATHTAVINYKFDPREL